MTMKIWIRHSAVIAAAVTAMGLAACSDDNNGPTGPGTDTTGPTVASVTSVDSRHINIVFNEKVNRTQAETESNYTIVETSPSPAPGRGVMAPGDPIGVLNASLRSDGKSVTLTTATAMTTTGYRITVNGIDDAKGNTIKDDTQKDFAGTAAADQTAPEIVFQSPASNANNVSSTDSLTFTFSEPLTDGNFDTSFGLRAGVNEVPVTVTSEDNVHFTVHPANPLNAGQLYTMSFIGIQDEAGNVMENSETSFHTSGTTDSTAPSLVSSLPSNNATNVGMSSTIAMTFSEPIDQDAFVASVSPTIGTGEPVFSNGGKTVTFTPADGLGANQQYMVTILPGGVSDMSGNSNDNPITVTFTTGAALQTGSISGNITGDQASANAKNPSGATVMVASADPFGSNGDFTIEGATAAQSDGTFTIPNLAPGTYFPFVLMDSNGDGTLDPLTGDAVGVFGANSGTSNTHMESVVVATNARTGVNIRLYDPTAITGRINYSGANSAGSYPVFVGLFSPTNFNRNLSVPIIATQSTWSGTGTFVINTLDVGSIPNGKYLIGGFLDVNGNALFDPQTDPFGLVGGGNPKPITLTKGTDANNLTLTLQDPQATVSPPTGVLRWSITRSSTSAMLKKLADQLSRAK